MRQGPCAVELSRVKVLVGIGPKGLRLLSVAVQLLYSSQFNADRFRLVDSGCAASKLSGSLGLRLRPQCSLRLRS